MSDGTSESGLVLRLRAFARTFSEIVGWHRLGIVLSLAIIALAAVALRRKLSGVDVDQVIAALRGTPIVNVLIAAFLVAGSYVSYTFFDLFALRTIGRPDIPYRVAALAAFTAYAIGHNLGATLFTGGAVRYRIYSAYALSVIDIAKIAFVTGLTFWLGNAVMLGLGMAWQPDAASAVDQLPPWLNRIWAVALLVAVLAYLAWVWRFGPAIGRNGWQLRLPSAPLTLAQIALGVFDLGCAGLATYVLMPATPEIGLLSLVVVFLLSLLIGFASHSPGGLGVFDAAMLVALQQFDREALLASLLLFRLLYFIIPFALALTILGGRELWINLRSRAGGDRK